MAVEKKIIEKFRIKKEPNTGLVATDETANAIQRSPRPNKDIMKRNLNRLYNYTGTDIEEGAKDYALSRQFQERSPKASSKMTNLGAAIGAGAGKLAGGTTGAMVGAASGATVGAKADATGGVWAGKILDKARQVGDFSWAGKYAPTLERALRTSPKALGITGAVLSQDPGFVKMLLDNQ